MSETQPPPIPPAPPQSRAPAPDAAYNILADKIGGVPNIRKKDNLYQGLSIAVFLVIGLIVGGLLGGWPMGIMLGALGGLVVGTLLSGLVLMVLGLGRKS